jgi:hypothetical protein
MSGQIEAHEAQVIPRVSLRLESRLESRLEWLSYGARRWQSKTRPPTRDADKDLKEILEKIVG